MSATIHTLCTILEEQRKGLRVEARDGVVRGYMGQQLVAEVDCNRLERALSLRASTVGDLARLATDEFNEQVERSELIRTLPDRVRESAYR